MKYPLLLIDKLRWGYAGSWQAGPLSAEIREGTIIVILGPNGSGKTTLLKTILGLRSPLEGHISIGGHFIQDLSIKERARLCSWVPQFFDPLWDFTVWDLVSQGRYAYSTVFHALTKEDRAFIYNTLTELDLTHLQSKRFSSLSGGQARQVLIARALCQDTPLIILDEPAANLDPGKQLELGELLQRLAAKGKTICISLHDINLAYRLAHEVILLFHDGSASWGPPDEILIPPLLEKAYNTTFVHGYHEEYGKFSLPSRRKKKGGRP